MNLRLPPAHAERLKLIAEAKGRSQSDVVCKMIERAHWTISDAEWIIDPDIIEFPEFEPLADPRETPDG